VQRRALMPSIRSLPHLYDFIGYMVLRAPDRYPTEDFLEPDEQMTLDRGFRMLKESLVYVPVPPDFPAFHSALAEVLSDSLLAYRRGDRKAGARRLLDFQNLIFGTKSDSGHSD
jgi:hypothetical protein